MRDMRILLAALALAWSFPTFAAPAPDRALAREIYEELVEIDTSGEKGTVLAVAAVGARLRAAGLPDAQLHDVGPSPSKRNLVARLRGEGAKPPLLLLAHLDVVTALRSDWSLEPFTLTERDGYFYGRGTADDKAMAAIFTALFVRWAEAKVRPERDVILALTADEEGGPENGVEWLLAERPELVDAGLVLNEGGGGGLRGGARLLHAVQASEKIYANYWLSVSDAGGHSSVPRRDNAIYRLAAALGRLERFAFPVELNEISQRYVKRASELESGELAAALAAIARDPSDASAAARLAGNPRYNALPQTARAHVNCRILPWRTPDETQRELTRVVADERVVITPGKIDVIAPPSPLDDEVMGAIEEITRAMWPGVPVVPLMSTGATDSRFFRMRGVPAYGVSGLFSDMDDIRAHGRDERLLVDSFHDGLTFLDQLVRRLAGFPKD